MIRISRRDTTVVVDGDWNLLYYPTGEYFIYKNHKEVAHGVYDSVIADSYNHQMSPDDRKENLSRDLKSWIEKAIKGRVTY